MGTSAFSPMAAVMVCLAGTVAILAFTLVWATNTARPIRRRAKRLTGRPADPNFYSPTGLQDERGIRSL